MDNLSAFLAYCRRVMQEKGITGAALSDMTGISRAQLSKYLNGVHEPNPANRRKIADALGIDYNIASDDSVALLVRREQPDPARDAFLNRMLHYYYALSAEDRDKLADRALELEALAQTKRKNKT